MPANWQPPSELPDLRRVGRIALDLETKDSGLLSEHGSSWAWGDGYICGVSIAYRIEGVVRAHYFPLRHPDSQNFDQEQIFRWLRDLIASDVPIVTQNGLYDWGWLHAEAGIKMPPAERLEEIGALATMVDENRHRYGLDALCAWRNLPGKDETLLREGCAALGLTPKRRKKFNPQAHIYQLPAHYVGRYAEQDPASTLLLFESLNPILDREGTRAAYRLEVDLLPMVLEMRWRGIRIDTAAAEQARDLLLVKRDAALVELSKKLGVNVGMAEIGRSKWRAPTFDQYGIEYPLTKKGNPSFTAGNTGWMHKHPHWLPQLIVKAEKYNNAAVNFLETYILGHVVNHAEIHPHRSDEGGTRSLRFSYSNPPLQLMPSRDKELAPLIRGVFLPEEGEVWAKPDISQQEFRFIVHHAAKYKLLKADEAAERYRDDPSTDFHELAATATSLEREFAKAVNYANAFGAGPDKFAEMIGKPKAEAREIYERYNREIPFVAQLAKRSKRQAQHRGFLILYDGARRHFNQWVAGGQRLEGAGPCSREEAERRIHDCGHPWYGEQLWRAHTHKAMNAQIQGDAARHTKLWMRACWREGIVPLLQMHDALECSVSSREQAELVARLACEVVKLEVPMQVDLKFGRTWGDAKHTWDELHAETDSHAELAGELLDDQERTQRETPILSNDSGDTPQPLPWEDSDEDENSSTTVEAKLPHEIVWATALEHDFPRAADAPPLPPLPELTSEDKSTPSGNGRFDEANLRRRMAEQGVPWDPPAPASDPSPPPSGNGGSNLTGFDTEEKDDGNDGDDDDDGGDSYPHGERDDIGRKVAAFYYRHLKGALYLKVVKRVTKSGKKSFPQYHLENGRWMKGAPAGPPIPYRLPALLTTPANATVEICEGERDADTLAALGLIATTNPGGAGKWKPELNKWFAGFARANVYEDNDKPGHKHAAEVASALCDVIPDIRIISFRELPEHGDVSDWLNGKTREELLARTEQAPKFIALESVCAADEEIEDYEWVWPDRLALKKIGLIVGLPDEGKGLVFSDIMARITCALAWPCGEGTAPLGNVILLTAEDDINDTIIPRLMAAGADLKRVHIVKMIHEAGKERMFSLVTDLHALRQKVIEVGDVRMVLIDPVSAYLGIGKVDSFRATDVRAILGPLKMLAEELRISILGIMHFNKKTDVTNVLLRISDSLAYGAASRHVYGVINDPDNHRRLFVRGKNNVARSDQKTLAFSIDTRKVGDDKRTGKPIHRPYVVWHDEPVDITATEALSAAAESKSPSARDNAKHFLEGLLGNGPVNAKDVREAAKENGISSRTLDRAREALDTRVDIKKDGPPNDKGESTWRWHWIEKRESKTDQIDQPGTTTT